MAGDKKFSGDIMVNVIDDQLALTEAKVTVMIKNGNSFKDFKKKGNKKNF